MLARLITHRGFLHDHAMVFLNQGDPEPFGLSVFYTPDEGGKKAFEAFQVLAEQAYRKAVALTDSTTTYWTFRNAAHERPAHLWAVGLERWAQSEEEISGIIPVERTPVQVEDNRLQIPGRHYTLGIGGSPLVADEAAYLIKNADRVDELKDDLFSASESAVQWLVEQLEPTEADAEAGVADALARTPVDTSTLPVDPRAEKNHTSPGRRPKRTDADKARDEGDIAAHLTEHPDATRDDVANETGIAPAHVSASVAWKAHTVMQKAARKANRARASGGVGDPSVDRYGGYEDDD